MPSGALIEAAGITAAIGVLLLAGLAIVANASFKTRGLPDDDGSEP